MLAQRQLVDPVEQHGKPLGSADDVEEGVQPGRLRVVAQQPLADRLPGPDPELFIGRVEQRFDPLPQALRGRAGGGQKQRFLRMGARLGQPGEAARQRLGLAAAGLTEQEQRATAVADRALLWGREVDRSTLPRAYCP